MAFAGKTKFLVKYQLIFQFRPMMTQEPRSCSRMGYELLVERILSGNLQPGEEINRRALAEELGISLAPINEAVGQLEAEGLVDVLPRRQTRVRIVRREEVRGLLILREAIECEAARIYCGKLVSENLPHLTKLAKAVDTSRPASAENERAETQFHGALVALVGAPLLSEEFQKVMRRRLFYKINAVVPWQTQPPLDSHSSLLKELSTARPDAAETAMRRHLERGREAMLQR